VLGSLLNVKASSAGDACLDVQIAVPTVSMLKEKEKKRKKRKDYAFRRQFNEKPSIIPGCPEVSMLQLH